MFESLLIANRGEIACRVIDTARRTGIKTVAVFSEADRGARHVRLADEARCIGPAPAIDSYLKVDRILEAARESGAEAVHPGYGFLSENADFADACIKAGLVFVGPTPATIRAMGSKSVAKDLMTKAGVPVVPDYRGADQSIDAFSRAIDGFGYPAMLKPAHGGGGKGMRRVDGPAELAEALEAAQREARAAFDNDEILAEKYVVRPRHVEVQVFGDSQGNVVHLFERDCTLQRRHQKIIEEAPAHGLSAEVRQKMHEAALCVAKAVDYRNAGTVEFLVDGDAFYFMEMNTRLQVEHPVTEGITGIDLVEWQLRVAAGDPLPLAQTQIQASGHAIEARVYAEAPDDGFLPSPGRVSALRIGRSGEVRLDTGVESGDVVQPFYDPMIAKVICHGANREQARQTLLDAVADAEIEGPTTNLAFLATLLASEAFIGGNADIQFVDRELAGLVPGAGVPSAFAVAAAFLEGREEGSNDDPWSDRSGWRLNLPPSRSLAVQVADETLTAAWYDGAGSQTARLAWAGEEYAVEGRREGRRFIASVNGETRDALVVRSSDSLYVIGDKSVERVDLVDPLSGTALSDTAFGGVVAPMPGKLSAVLVTVGQAVARGDRLAIVEAMKMEHVLRAGTDGIVTAVHQAEGAFVDDGSLLVEIEAPPQ